MRSSRQKLVTFGVIVLGVGVFVVGSVALRKPAIEQWYAWKLQRVPDREKWAVAQKLQEMDSSVAEEWYLSKLEATVEEEREAAASKLGEMKSLRAVQRLIELIGIFGPELYVVSALVEIGPRAVPELLETIRDGETKACVRLAVAKTLRDRYPEAVEDLDKTIEELDQLQTLEFVRYLLGAKS